MVLPFVLKFKARPSPCCCLQPTWGILACSVHQRLRMDLGPNFASHHLPRWKSVQSSYHWRPWSISSCVHRSRALCPTSKTFPYREWKGMHRQESTWQSQIQGYLVSCPLPICMYWCPPEVSIYSCFAVREKSAHPYPWWSPHWRITKASLTDKQ